MRSLAVCGVLLLGLCHASRLDVWCENNEKVDSNLIDAVNANSSAGDEVVFNGHCVLVSPVQLRGDRTYRGNSRTGTVLKQADGVNLDAVVASDSFLQNETWTGSPVRLAHLTVDGNALHNNGTSNLVVRSWMTVIEDVHIVNAPVDGILLTNLALHGAPLKTSQVNGVISNCFVENSGQHGIHVLDTGNSITDWSLLNCWISTSRHSALFFENIAGWQVRGNHIYGVGEHAIFGNRCFATTIADNYIEDFGGVGGTQEDTWYGVACTMQGGAGSVISGNKIFQLGARPAGTAANYVYIGVPKVNEGVGVLNVANNLIRGWNGSSDVGLLYQSGSGHLEVASDGNNIQTAGTPRVTDKGVTLIQTY